MQRIEFYRHNIEEEDIAAVNEVLRSTFLTTGPSNQVFEQRFAQYTDLPEVLSVSSCTGAMHLALLALGVGPGDEVITTPMTFVATALAIMHTGATPVFADVEPETGLIDPAAIEAAITPRTTAILPVHLYGAMADMRAIRRIADAHGLAVVEDAAHCIEGERDGLRPGWAGDAACYSFYATKNLACGEGGAIGLRDSVLAEKLRRLRLHGMSADAATRYKTPFRHWDVPEPGWKYNMDSIHAALLIHQIDRLDGYLERREAICQRYEKALAEEGLRLPAVPGKSARHLQTIWVDAEQRDETLQELQKAGIGCTVNYRAVHTLSYFREELGYRPEDFPNAYKIGTETLSLPLYPKLQASDFERVINVLKEKFAK